MKHFKLYNENIYFFNIYILKKKLKVKQQFKLA